MIIVNDWIKRAPYHFMFAHASLEENVQALNASKDLMNEPLDILEEKMHTYHENNHWKIGSYFYRIFLDPEEIYGKKEQVSRE